MSRALTADEVRALPAVLDLPTAARALGIGRDLAYRLADSGAFPVPVMRLGRYLRVTRASLLVLLGIAEFVPSTSPTEADTTPVGGLSLDLVSGAANLDGVGR